MAASVYRIDRISERPPQLAVFLFALFAASALVVNGTSVWTGRALQAGFDVLEIFGLAHLYSAL
jgi:hypothetical protein